MGILAALERPRPTALQGLTNSVIRPGERMIHRCLYGTMPLIDIDTWQTSQDHFDLAAFVDPTARPIYVFQPYARALDCRSELCEHACEFSVQIFLVVCIKRRSHGPYVGWNLRCNRATHFAMRRPQYLSLRFHQQLRQLSRAISLSQDLFRSIRIIRAFRSLT